MRLVLLLAVAAALALAADAQRDPPDIIVGYGFSDLGCRYQIFEYKVCPASLTHSNTLSLARALESTDWERGKRFFV